MLIRRGSFAEEAACCGALMLGVLGGHAVLYAALGWDGGFNDPELWALKRFYLRRMPWLLAAAVPLGLLLARLHRKGLEAAQGRAASPGPMLLLAIPRIFLVFPCYGFVILFQAIGWMILAGLAAAWQKLSRRSRNPPDLQTRFGSATALQLMIGPLAFAEASPPWPGVFRMLRFLPVLLVVLWFWTFATSEDTGDRVDPRLLSLAASFWLGDFLVVLALRVRDAAFGEG